jgi:RNase P subunit RPR2
MDPPKCPECGWEARLPIKKWILKVGPRNGRTITVSIYECLNPECSYLLRTGERRRWREIKPA